jgi:hypothetical protein
VCLQRHPAVAYLHLVRCMQVPRLIKHWPIAFCCLICHTFGVLYILRTYSVSNDPNSPMIWLYPIGFDWPSSLILSYSDIRTTFGITISLLLLGGLLWTLLGGLLDRFLRYRRSGVAQSPTENER